MVSAPAVASKPAKNLSILGTIYPVETLKAAYQRAHAEGVRVFRVDGQWYTNSISQPNRRHHVIGTVCDCQASRKGHLCKHVAAVFSARMKIGELVRCPHCGIVGEAGTDIVERLGYVGGKGYETYTQCADEVACWQRWDKANGFAS